LLKIEIPLTKPTFSSNRERTSAEMRVQWMDNTMAQLQHLMQMTDSKSSWICCKWKAADNKRQPKIVQNKLFRKI